MRFDKLTTPFQHALADAQSLAVASDHPYVEPAHLLTAMLQQADGPKALLDRAGANTAALAVAMEVAAKNLPQVQVDRGGAGGRAGYGSGAAGGSMPWPITRMGTSFRRGSRRLRVCATDGEGTTTSMRRARSRST